MRRHDQRRGARPPADDHVPAPHAVVQRRRQDRHRAVAGQPLPGDQGPRRRPAGLRPDHPGRWLHLRPDRDGAGGARDAGAQEGPDAAFDAATCIGCGACVAACPNASSMLFTAAKVTHLGLLPRDSPSATTGWSTWSPSRTARASVAAPTSASARTPVPRASRWRPSPASTMTCSARSGPERAPRASTAAVNVCLVGVVIVVSVVSCRVRACLAFRSRRRRRWCTGPRGWRCGSPGAAAAAVRPAAVRWGRVGGGAAAQPLAAAARRPADRRLSGAVPGAGRRRRGHLR
ncbi:4Fe-4S binding protein [Blastococcus brunescens]|uniref:4Fe-4S binding protein n=1 Tax=Blastococcus brunescens TaxID=1564165 RepID=A0ABZ1BAH9_9ACTN|nr:4Fe-4S binding protein [Blastococcus sp. BMG 8361]WRL66841.1 4Fe-4S binding protein [Blastococcus sp. BMG 8361]